MYQVSLLQPLDIVRKRPKLKWLTLVKLLTDGTRTWMLTHSDYHPVGYHISPPLLRKNMLKKIKVLSEAIFNWHFNINHSKYCKCWQSVYFQWKQFCNFRLLLNMCYRKEFAPKEFASLQTLCSARSNIFSLQVDLHFGKLKRKEMIRNPTSHPQNLKENKHNHIK